MNTTTITTKFDTEALDKRKQAEERESRVIFELFGLLDQNKDIISSLTIETKSGRSFSYSNNGGDVSY